MGICIYTMWYAYTKGCKDVCTCIHKCVYTNMDACICKMTMNVYMDTWLYMDTYMEVKLYVSNEYSLKCRWACGHVYLYDVLVEICIYIERERDGWVDIWYVLYGMLNGYIRDSMEVYVSKLHDVERLHELCIHIPLSGYADGWMHG